MVIHQSLAVVFCGHRPVDRKRLPFHCLDAAVGYVQDERTLMSLLICGDSRGGMDVAMLGDRAARVIVAWSDLAEMSVPPRVVPLFDGSGNALSDVRLVLRWINAMTDPQTNTTVHLFVEEWCARIAAVMLEDEASRLLADGRIVIVKPHPVLPPSVGESHVS